MPKKQEPQDAETTRQQANEMRTVARADPAAIAAMFVEAGIDPERAEAGVRAIRSLEDVDLQQLPPAVVDVFAPPKSPSMLKGLATRAKRFLRGQ